MAVEILMDEGLGDLLYLDAGDSDDKSSMSTLMDHDS